MFNDVTLVGNAVSQPEMRYTPSGTAVASFNLAVNKYYKDQKTGESRQQTMFIEIVSFGKQAEVVRQYVTKGMRVLVNGELHQDIWVDNYGNKRSKHNIHASRVVFLQCKSAGSSQGTAQAQAQTQSQPEPRPNTQPRTQAQPEQPSLDDTSIDDLPDEDIPF